MPRLISCEYEPVVTQAAGRAVCPFCNAWHARTTGARISGSCDAKYVRRRKVALAVVGVNTGIGGGTREPTSYEVDAAFIHAGS